MLSEVHLTSNKSKFSCQVVPLSLYSFSYSSDIYWSPVHMIPMVDVEQVHGSMVDVEQLS